MTAVYHRPIAQPMAAISTMKRRSPSVHAFPEGEPVADATANSRIAVDRNET